MAGTDQWHEISPESVGLSRWRLGRIDSYFEREIESNQCPGAVILVIRHDQIAYSRALGTRSGAGSSRMTIDTIFRIYSMTKTLTSAAAVMMIEQGRLTLSTPISTYLPEFHTMAVAPGGSGSRIAASPKVPAMREITVRDLLLHTSGITGGVHGAPEICALYREAQILPFDHTQDAYSHTSQDLVERLSRIPLAHHPGMVWEYGRSGDVLGRLIEVASGCSLDQFLATHIFEPLEMEDTGFRVPEVAKSRMAQPLERQSDGRKLIDIIQRPSFISGGSGAFSTALDYLRFASALLHGGRFNGVRILGKKMAELMTTDHLGTLAGSGPDYIPEIGYGFGFGCAVRLKNYALWPGSPGDFWWLGRAGTCFLVDPKEDLIAVLMLQKYGRARHYHGVFRTLVYQALED